MNFNWCWGNWIKQALFAKNFSNPTLRPGRVQSCISERIPAVFLPIRRGVHFVLESILFHFNLVNLLPSVCDNDKSKNEKFEWKIYEAVFNVIFRKTQFKYKNK